jgi:hypothetical protein
LKKALSSLSYDVSISGFAEDKTLKKKTKELFSPRLQSAENVVKK